MWVIEELRSLGFEIEAVGDRVRVRHPFQPRPEALPLLEHMRQHKADVLAALAGPQPQDDKEEPCAETIGDVDVLDGIVAGVSPVAPTLPSGLRLISYVPRRAPVALEHCSIVTNVELFIRSSLAELEDKLKHPDANNWGWPVAQILDRLRQVGLVLEIEKVAPNTSSK